MNSTKTLAIVICTERGPLESMSKLMIASIRKFGGQLKDVPIYSYQPRKGLGISKETKSFFNRHRVELIDEVLNTDHHDYPLANKIYAASHAEQNMDSEILVFIDSDIFFLNEPTEFLIPKEYDVVLRPVDSKNVGAESVNDPNWEYWKKLYQLFGVKEHAYVTTSIDKKRVLSYWNSGHLVVRRNRNIFQRWKENFEIVMKDGLMPNDSIFYVEQTVFAATISAMKCRVKKFSPFYNYPIHLQSRITEPGERAVYVNELISAHYHRIFKAGFANQIIGPMINSKDEKSRWLIKRLVDFGLIENEEIILPNKNPASIIRDFFKSI